MPKSQVLSIAKVFQRPRKALVICPPRFLLRCHVSPLCHLYAAFVVIWGVWANVLPLAELMASLSEVLLCPGTGVRQVTRDPRL